ncbi:MAG: prolyl oligopeptidase family serine peptidase [Holophagales bacterium]|nr:prolyl oligopeptidase family serine peptidase [Holophagales bacterium]MYG29319.1 prolyl oligopeptidase family serine peptidase [Holophagales bacterium]MYI81111.1 prolyl oligopeptidase family serine peptidase [Holophagales bacterium]
MRSAIAIACSLLALAFIDAAAAQSHPGSSGGYLSPPQEIVGILDAPPTPGVLVSPNRDVIVLTERRSMPPISWQARPLERLAGYRIDPRNSGPWRAPETAALTIRRVEEDASTEGIRIDAPHGTTLGWPQFSPDGSHLSYAVLRDTGIELWVIDIGSGKQRALTSASLNATWGNPCQWLFDSSGVLCRFRVPGRGAPPSPPRQPGGPNIQEHDGRLSPVRTYQDLLANPYDEALFEYHFTSRIETVDLATGKRTPIGEPGLFMRVSGAPDSRHVLVERLEHPFSWLHPASRFPRSVEVWTRDDGKVATVATLPLADAVPIGGVPTGPRSHRWNPTKPATLVWSEAQDGGDPKAEVPHRDHLFALDAPFDGRPRELTRTEHRFTGIGWTADGTALVNEYDRETRWFRTSLLDVGGDEPRTLFDRSAEDRYGDPGFPWQRPGGGTASSVVLQDGDSIYLMGRGASPEGDLPFVDRLNLDTLATERLFRSESGTYETAVAVLAADGGSLLTRRESTTEPPNYFATNLSTGDRRALTDFSDPAPILRQVEKRLLTYEREDGVGLSATLYLPPGYQEGDRPPMLLWAYPREYTNPNAASQVTGSPHRFTTLRGASHLLLLTQGYAILDGPTMPIVGEGETANDSYVEQLVSSAKAAIDRVVELGVADPDRIAIGGHSYGAFMTANLLAHSDLFAAGIARSGAYNRSLTPFGFQNERRTFWEAQHIYAAMSPFFHAEKVNEPILLTHGEIDNNSGTFPIQSERFYQALKGHGATVRYVTMPHESHGYAARESVLHVVAEMLNWCDRYLRKGQ